MGFTIGNFVNSNPNLTILEKRGCFSVFQHDQDLSVYPGDAEVKYYLARMNGCQKQLLVELNGNAILLAARAMQYMIGNVTLDSGVKGFGDYIGKVAKSKVTKDSAVKPRYYGTGIVVTEPTYKHLLIEDVGEWDGMVCDDGMFVACDATIQDTVVMRDNMSSAALGREGLFNTCLTGKGYAVIQSPCARNELIEVHLNNDVMKIDGNMAVAWSKTLSFTVEKAATSLVGSALSGEGFVNVYRGTGKILMCPI